MEHYFTILLATVLVHNLVLEQLIGVTPALAVTRRPETALGMGLATSLVLVLAAPLAWLLEMGLLRPLGLGYLRLVALVLALMTLVAVLQRLLDRAPDRRWSALAVFLPLVAMNSTVLGVALLALEEAGTLLQAACFGLAAGLGFTLVLVLFAGLRERLRRCDLPMPLRGAPVALITLAILAMAFAGFG